MASTYSALKIELIGTGEQAGTWGATSNVNFDTALGEAITGSADVNFATAADVTITLTDTNTAQTARNLRLNITESSSGIGYVGNLILGSGCQIEKLYLINNTTTAAKTIKNTTGTGISVAAGKSMFVFNNGTNVVEAVNSAATLAVSGAATFGSTAAFTGAASFAADSSFNSTGAVKVPVGTTAQQPAGADGKIRYNSTTASYEGYSGASWDGLGNTKGGGAISVNNKSVSSTYTITATQNGFSVGPITFTPGVTVTTAPTSRWIII
jgi:hypothetical protein